jgi:peptide/nickel transport system substrate-binding protein
VLLLSLVLLTTASARPARYGGTLVVGISGDPDTLDPTVSRTSQAVTIYQTMCVRLYETAENHGSLELTPVLAASLPVLSPDKLSYTVQLRQGILFNDGTPLNAAAVVASYQRMVTTPGSSRANDFVDVASASASGPYTVVFHLKARDSSFTSNLYVLSPTAIANEGSGFGASPVCAGPFMFDHRVLGDNVTVVKSPWWYKRAAVHLDKIVYKVIPDPTAAAAALKANDLQVLLAVAPSELAGVEEDTNLKVLQGPQLGWRGIIFNVGDRNGLGNLPYTNLGTPFASSPLLRQAFDEAIDRKTLNRVAFGGLFQPSCTTIPPANTLWYPLIQIPCTPYDPQDARRLVAKAGFPNPTIHLLVQATPEYTTVDQVIQAEEAAVGINVVLDLGDPATVTARETSGNFEAAIAGFEAGAVEPNGQIYQFFATNGARDYGGYSNPRMDYVLNDALRATNIKARAVSYRVAQQIIETDRPTVILWNTATVAAYSSSVTGIQLLANGSVSLNNAQYR